MSKLNIKWKGKEDWESLSEKERNDKIYQAALYETSAVYNLPRVFEKVKSPENVLVFTKAIKDFIGIGSTKASSAKHWVGFGVLAKNKKQLKPVILTPSQYESLMKHKYHSEPLSILGNRNFTEIIIADEIVIAECIGKK